MGIKWNLFLFYRRFRFKNIVLTSPGGIEKIISSLDQIDKLLLERFMRFLSDLKIIKVFRDKRIKGVFKSWNRPIDMRV